MYNSKPRPGPPPHRTGIKPTVFSHNPQSRAERVKFFFQTETPFHDHGILHVKASRERQQKQKKTHAGQELRDVVHVEKALVISRLHLRAPQFLVVLLPHRAGDLL